MEKQATKPYHPLIGKQPVETLSYVQTLLSFAEEFTAQATEGSELTHHQIRVYDGLYTLLKLQMRRWVTR